MLKRIPRIGSVLGAAFLIICLGAGEGLSDKIILQNGDQLTGTLKDVIDGKLTLVTDYAGPIVVPVEKIKEIYTDKPVAVHLKDGEILKGKIKSGEDKKLAVESSPERAETTVAMENVKSINPPPVQWGGSVAAGGNLQSGNTDRAGASIAINLGRRAEKDRITLRYIFNYGEEEDEVTTRDHYGEGKYDYFFMPKFYGYMALEMRNDRFADTKLRTVVGPGIGYQVWDDPGKSLLVEGGLGYFSFDRYEGEDKDGLTGRLALDFRYAIFKWLAFTDRFVFTPTIGEGGLYFYRNEAALIAPLGAGFSLRLSNIIDYQSDPEPGFDKTDVQWIGALQYSF